MKQHIRNTGKDVHGRDIEYVVTTIKLGIHTIEIEKQPWGQGYEIKGDNWREILTTDQFNRFQTEIAQL